MNKNPFLPQPSYTPQQPPLPPGPPPPQPTQPDYSAYWAAAAAAHQQQPHVQPPTVGQYNPQWSAPQPQPPRPPAEQSALYANYGYGNQQNSHWQRQQQQQQLHLQQQQYHAAAPPVTQPPPQPPAQPGYNPYQPTAGYPQQYVPQGMPAAPQQMSQAVYPHPPPQQQQQQFFPQHIPPQQQHQQQPQQPRHHIHHTPPQHMPPAKRQRFDGPNPPRHGPNQHHAPPPPQPQFQAPPPPAQNMGPFAGPGRGGPPGMGHMPMGGGRGGPGGRGGAIAGGRGGRGAPMIGTRGGLPGRGRGGGSGGSGYIGGGGGGGRGGGGSSGSLRGHGSRGNFGNQNRRGGGSFTSGGGGNYPHQGPSFRGRSGQGHSGSNRGGRHDGGGGASFTSRDGQSSSSFGSVGKKDENRRTLTDFKIVGLEIDGLSWTWGILPSTEIKLEVKDEEIETVDHTAEPSLVTIKEEPIKEEAMDEDTSLKPSVEEETPTQPEVVVESEIVVPDTATPAIEPPVVVQDVPQVPVAPRAASEVNAHTPPPSRIRIYFHTPVTADDSRPIPHNAPPAFTFGATPSDSRKGKRKKLEDDDGDMEEGRARPPPPQGSGMSDDRSSVAASVAPSVAETASEADWLMAAITEGEEEAEAEGELTHDRDRDDDEDGDQLRVSQIVEAHDNDSNADADGDTENVTVTDGIRVDDVDVDMWAADSGAHAPEAGKINGGAPLENGVTPATNGVDVSSLDATSAETIAVEAFTVGGTDADPAPTIVSQLDGVTLTPDNDVPAASDSAASASAPHEPSVSDSVASSQNDSSVEEHPADHIGLPDVQVPLSPPRTVGVVKTLQAASAEPTLLDVNIPTAPSSQDDDITVVNGHHMDEQATQETQSQAGDTEATQIDHLPEPPASPPLSTTLLSTASTSTFGDSPTTLAKPEVKTGRTPSANRLSISYAGGNRRLVVDAEIVESLKLFRQEGRIEVVLTINKEDGDGLKGILLEGLSDLTKSYLPLQIICDEAESDPTLPPFSKVPIPSSLTLRVYLDTERPLSEPKWAKSGDIQEWLKTMFGRMFWVAGDAAEGWEKKIQVIDPDPPPTIWTVLDGWATNSPAGVLNERQRFLKTHMTETDNILEILLRLVRGERATASYQSTPAISAPSVSGPLLSALSQGSAHGSQQTHVSLAVLALFRMSVEYAKKALGDKGKGEVEERVGEIIRCLPSHLVYKSLDGIFKEWRVEKKGR